MALKNNGTIVNAQITVDANNFDLVIEDLSNLIPKHKQEFTFKIKSFNNDHFSQATGKIEVRVRRRINYPPNADAGANRTLIYDSSVGGTNHITINGRNSSDPNRDALTYQWSLINAPDVISIQVNPNTPYQVRVLANNLHHFIHSRSFTVKLRVTDPFGLFDEDTTQVTLNDLNTFNPGEDSIGIKF